jgi:hypothetical protein
MKEAARAGTGKDISHYIAIVAFVIGLFFVWRSFYATRIPEKH